MPRESSSIFLAVARHPAILLVLYLSLSVAPMSRAATLEVDGNCTLVDAIHSANDDVPTGGCPAGDPGEDEIVLTQDVVLTEVDNDVRGIGPTGTPLIVSPITIDGRGFLVSRDAKVAAQFRILHVEGGPLFLKNTTITNGSVEVPGGFSSDPGGGAVSGGRVVIEDSTFRDNEVFGSGRGGALYLSDESEVLRSVVVDNQNHEDAGGGIYGSGRIADSIVYGNQALGDEGGGVKHARWVERSVIANNSSAYFGGGIHSHTSAPLVLIDSTVSGNSPYGISWYGKGGHLIERSTISGNIRHGVSVINSGDPSTIRNSTISGNGEDGVNLEVGGDVVSPDLLIVVQNTTIASNSGAGIWFEDYSAPDLELTFGNNIVAGNLGGNCVKVSIAGTVIDTGGNLDDDGSCGRAAPIRGIDLELKENGGPTQTHALLPGSEAIDSAGACGLAVDQRGVPRPPGACDSGAFEFTDTEPRLSILAAGNCPRDVMLAVLGAAPNSEIVVFWSDSLGEGQVPSGDCAGTSLDLADPKFLNRLTVDRNGVRVADLASPLAACGAFLQVLSELDCTVSAPAEMPSPPG